MRCADGTLYTGIARDVTRRIAEHNAGGKLGARYTRGRRPVKLVYQEAAATRSAASRRECAIKLLSRQQKQALIVAASGARKRKAKVVAGKVPRARQRGMANNSISNSKAT